MGSEYLCQRGLQRVLRIFLPLSRQVNGDLQESLVAHKLSRRESSHGSGVSRNSMQVGARLL